MSDIDFVASRARYYHMASKRCILHDIVCGPGETPCPIPATPEKFCGVEWELCMGCLSMRHHHASWCGSRADE